MHARADDPFFNESRGDLRVVRALPIYSDLLGLYGIADCVEFRRNETGAWIDQLGGLYRVTVVEYKSGKTDGDGGPKHHDAMQVYAQMRCLDEMFRTHSAGAVYYAKTRRRAVLVADESLKTELNAILTEMRRILKRNEIPAVPDGQNCKGCSVRDVCFPHASKYQGFYRTIDRKLNLEAE